MAPSLTYYRWYIGGPVAYNEASDVSAMPVNPNVSPPESPIRSVDNYVDFGATMMKVNISNYFNFQNGRHSEFYAEALAEATPLGPRGEMQNLDDILMTAAEQPWPMADLAAVESEDNDPIDESPDSDVSRSSEFSWAYGQPPAITRRFQEEEAHDSVPVDDEAHGLALEPQPEPQPDDSHAGDGYAVHLQLPDDMPRHGRPWRPAVVDNYYESILIHDAGQASTDRHYVPHVIRRDPPNPYFNELYVTLVDGRHPILVRCQQQVGRQQLVPYLPGSEDVRELRARLRRTMRLPQGPVFLHQLD